MDKLLFPFDKIRPIQDKMIKDVCACIAEKKCLIAHAPTGLGKTAAALGPAVTSAIENGHDVFFLTPKHTQHYIAIETIKKINEKNKVHITASDLIGKKWMCSVDAIEKLSSREFAEFCKDLRTEERCPFYNNVFGKKNQLKDNAAKLIENLKGSGPYHVEEIIRKAREQEFCSYEIAFLGAKDANVIVADYFHLFSPRVRDTMLVRLKKKLSNSIIIIDEGHNLPSRIRDLLTNRLSSIGLNRAIKEAKAHKLPEIEESMFDVLDDFNRFSKSKLKSQSEAEISKEDVLELFEKSSGYSYDDLIAELTSAATEVRKISMRSQLGAMAHFLEEWTSDDVGYARILKKARTKSGKYFVDLNHSCLSPDIASKDVFSDCISAIIMSGTLTPGDMYRDVLGFPMDTKIKEYPSPFPRDNRLVVIDPSLTTKFTERTEEQFQNIAAECARIINKVKYNVAVFFPSYLFLQSVLPYLEGKVNKTIFIEKSDMIKEQKMSLLESFKNSADSGGLLLGVQGSNFAEGIDYPGKLLEAVIVVGVPLSKPDLETKSLIEYYDLKFKKGWDYGYSFPAMTRALQAAGRCIRSRTDKGAIVLMDKRFTWQNYLKCIPPEWNPQVTKLGAQKVAHFFKNKI